MTSRGSKQKHESKSFFVLGNLLVTKLGNNYAQAKGIVTAVSEGQMNTSDTSPNRWFEAKNDVNAAK